MITIKGVLSRLTYQNPDNQYTVCRIQVEKIQDPITVVGYLAGVAEGETLTLNGQWTSHPKYGDQFKAETYEVTLPATVSGIRKYLGSGMIKGISKSLADRIVDKFQNQTLEIIENQPEKLMEVAGIARGKKQLIQKAWNTHHAVRRVMQFLQENNVNVAHAGLILKTYGAGAMAVLETDPFRIAIDIPAIGFAAADAVARAKGVEKTDENRLCACLLCQLIVFEGDGHVYADKEELFAACARLAGVGSDLFSPALDTLADRNEIQLWDDRVYLSRLFKAEKGIADRLSALLSMPVPEYRISRDEILEQVLTGMAVKLSDEQLEVVCQVMVQKVSVITGGPGTGKTTLVRALCQVFRHLRLTVVLAAPTGRAARRLSETTGKKAFTLHKLLGFDTEQGTVAHNFTNPLNLDVFVVDEASMVDTQLMFHLVEAMPPGASLVLVGDTFQLPSVGPGNVLSDIMASGRVSVFALTKIFRQARQSPIVRHAHDIRNGRMPDFKTRESQDLSEFYFIENQHPEKVVHTILELCARRIPKTFPHITDFQVLTPMHRGEAGTINLNQQLQSVLNPGKGGVDNRGVTFRPGDKVMHLKNNYEKEVFNGDIGQVTDVSKSEGKVMVEYDGRMVPYDLLELDELTLAYAVSVHKSQGSEYGAVIIALTMAHYPLLQRNLLYTALTRGKHLVIIVGSSRAVHTAFENNRTNLRRSGLKDRLSRLC
ncbi:MAG: ATP-dependent RecD-like DNA helicase [Desulfotignum sp.]|nr:ATP-dependent RecD-like DNA helicase [Desulfotignum sp.]MCF8112974.1 ATP-dependent RecD-like DNA helicase [Desulfotignum sp.]MCF8125582.1 ATP-dependent RecD-like DNA helicase [Desulfotignum sp.]